MPETNPPAANAVKKPHSRIGAWVASVAPQTPEIPNVQSPVALSTAMVVAQPDTMHFKAFIKVKAA